MADGKGQKPKIKQAIALGYDPGQDDAPRIIASGQGAIAEKILDPPNIMMIITIRMAMITGQFGFPRRF